MMEIKATFFSRPKGYKAGVCLMLIAFVSFTVGYAVCFSSERYGAGLPLRCLSVPGSHYLAWFQVVRLLETMCLTGHIAACVYAVFANCCRPIGRRYLEIITAQSGVLGFTGCMVFLGMTKYDHGILPYLQLRGELAELAFAWAFYLATVASALSVIAAVLIAIFNKPVSTPTSYSENIVMYTAAATQN